MSVVAMRRCWPVEAWSTFQSRGPCICEYDGRLTVAVGHGIVVRESTPLAPLRIVLPSPTAGQQFDILVQGRRVQFQPRSHGWQSMSCHDAQVHT